MTKFSRSRRLGAFTRIELLVILVALALMAALAIPTLLAAKAKAQRIRCVSHLKNIGLGIRIFATDNSDLFPWQTNVGRMPSLPPADEVLQHFLTLSNELSVPLLLVCRADTRKPARDWPNLKRENISYWLGLDAAEVYPQSFMVGDRNLMTNGVRLGPGCVKITQNSNLSWDPLTQHKSQGNLAMGDGSVQQLSVARLNEQWNNIGITNESTFLFP